MRDSRKPQHWNTAVFLIFGIKFPKMTYNVRNWRFTMKNPIQKTALALAISSVLLLSACKHDEESTSNEDPITTSTSGVITGFGSVFVNGIEYETGSATFVVDGVSGGEELLKLGMVISLTGSTATNGTGNATSIEFDDDIEGAVISNDVDANGIGTLNIMGVTVTVDEYTVFESNANGILTMTDITAGNIIEVSGYASADGSVLATRLEVKSVAKVSGAEMEVKGSISALDETNQTFSIGTMTVDYSSASLGLDNGTISLANDLLVVIKSTQDIANNILVADSVSLEDGGRKAINYDANADTVKLEGVITQVISATEIEVNGNTVLLTNSPKFVHGSASTAAQGMKVTVKGHVNIDGVLIAEKVTFKPSGDLSLAGKISATDIAANSITVFGVTIMLNNSTLMNDDRDASSLSVGEENVKYKFSADDLAIGDWVELRAYSNTTGSFTATKMRRATVDVNTLEKLEGKLVFNSVDTIYSIASIPLDLFSATQLTPADGMKVELKGSYSNDIFVATESEVLVNDKNYIAGDMGESHMGAKDDIHDGKQYREKDDDENDSPHSMNNNDDKDDKDDSDNNRESDGNDDNADNDSDDEDKGFMNRIRNIM